MSRGARAGTVIAVVLLAANLRPAVVAVSPMLTDIRAETGLSGPAAALLTTIPVLCFGLLAPFAPLLARRIGLVPALVAVLCAMTAGGLLRLPEPVVLLFAGTAVFGAAIAAGNVLLPVLVKREFPDRAGTMMGVYSVSLSTGAAIAAGTAVPLLLLFGHAWRSALAIWALPPVIALLAWLPLLRNRSATAPAAIEAPRTPLRRAPLAWAVTGFMGLQSLVYYATVAWLPEILIASGSGQERAGYALSVFNLVGIAGSLIFTLTVGRTRNQAGYALASAVLYAVGFGGLLTGNLDFLWAALLGLAQGITISLALALILLRMPDAGHAARMSGMAQAIGYLLAAAGPVLVGAVHDATGGWSWPLLLLGALLVPMAAAGAVAGRDVTLEVPTTIGVRS
ncbi:CP family cyanate transporter-like MFS transporter [Catenuloplanes nepalensis]|uniref:CP family cyanate transporter-like MFS transporter n=1 Tax=Catenuloplanes nepalensis TaxID=587533 RepID=A0ABT9N4M4_9ACTN|nr:MFS transporter [Catenuloplanes nepalensis]MDP9798647.1 CP family cyanate transporter-like MFS transporter [Catenuloplanes nepalensis]